MDNHLTRLSFIILFLSFLFSCSENKLEVDVSNIQAEVELRRYEVALSKIELSRVEQGLNEIKDSFPFLGDTITMNTVFETQNFLTDPYIPEIRKNVMEVYPDVAWLKTKLTTAFQHIKYYYPDTKIPLIFTHIIGNDYNMRLMNFDSVIFIALDMYLGPTFGTDYYAKFQIAKYQSDRLTKNHVLIDLVNSIVNKKVAFKKSDTDLISQMINEGRKLYLLNAFLPNEPDSLLMGYNSNQLKWCENNETQIWQYFIEKKILYSNDETTLKHFISDAPYTVPFSKEAPARIGTWVGLQIVRAYMDKNKDMSVVDLMQLKEPKEILNKANYKP